MANELIGFASLPADTFAEGPQSGADDGEGNPIEANDRTGPFDGQPVQGFSGVQFAPDNSGAFWFLSDNGFGAQENSTDYLLRIYQADPNFAGAENGDGSVEVQDFVQLSDPDNLIPFDIINEDSEERLLTGGDFDVESFVFDSNGDIWVGDEFGPYLLHFDRGGTLLEAPVATPNYPRLNTLNGQEPLVIAHRGASGLLPEHTLEAYRVAIAQGADFIEPDLVSTKDGVLIDRHEPILDDTTNVAEVFSEDRMSTKNLDGEEVTAYFAEDFTLAEIKQLRAVQQNDFRSQEFNGAFEIPTFQEVIELVQEVEAQTGVEVGIYPETKHPTYFDLQDLSPEEPLIETLQSTGFTDPNRIFIQSFEFENLIKLQGMLDEAGLGDIPLVQLYGDTTEDASPDDGFSVPYDIRYNLEQGNDLEAIYGQEFVAAVENGLSAETTYRDMDSAEFLQVIADLYAEGAGPWKNNILLRESLEEPVDGNDDGEAEITTQLTGEITSFINDAHAAGLQVHPYTLRNEERYLTLEADGTPQTPEREFEQLIQIGADGVFTDFPGTGVEVRDAVVADFVKSPQNPTLGEDQLANLNRSQGFEGMAFSPDGSTIYPLLEGSVLGDPENALRIYKFDVESGEYGDKLVGYYPTEDSHPIGDFTPINENEFLVIERDNNEGEEAEFKKIFKIDFSKVDKNGFVAKEKVVDLLDIQDPKDLNGDGKTSFDFPFVTIEDVVVVDENTLLVANDNNYPFSMGREGDIDNNEVILINLDKPLNLDPNLGGNALTPNFLKNNGDTKQPRQMKGLNGYSVNPIFTVGEKIGDYAPPGVPDGLGAFALDDNTVRILSNHEFSSEEGYAYTLANGTQLTGGRVSYFDIDKETRKIVDSGQAFDTIINRAGEEVDEVSDLEYEGLNRLCSAHYIEAHQFGEGRGLEDGLFFTGEETDGGTEFVLDPATNTLHAVPWMGRAAWENVTEIDTGSADKVAIMVGDDREAAPLLLYVGEKDKSEGANLLARNGLEGGKLYAWVPDGDVADSPTFLEENDEIDADDAPDPEGFNGTGNSLSGSWVELDYYRPDLAGTAMDTDGDGEIQNELGYDESGFATQAQQDQLFIDAGGFQFSRPEDTATNPEDGSQAVFSSTGRGGRFPEDNWGTTYTVDTEFNESGDPLTAKVNILYDGDDAGGGQFEAPDFGLRSPDNLDWADDGYIYVQEDRSTFADQNLSIELQNEQTFGAVSGEEASIWRIDPESGEATRVAQMNRDGVPKGQSDSAPDEIGEWESSGVLDVSELFGEKPGDLLLFDVQAHSLEDGVIASENLVQGGQLAFLEREQPATETPKAKNVIIMVGDGMGWEMARAAAIQRLINEGNEGSTLSDFYTEGTGSGLSFQELEEYALATTATTYIDGSKDNSALQGDTFDHVTGGSELREGFEYSTDAAIVEGFSPAIRERINGEVDADGNPLEPTYDPELGFNENPILDANGDPLGGNLPIYDLDLGGAYPWEQGADPEYIKNLYPDSANTATTLYTGEKTYSGAIGVDIFEETVETLGERAEAEGKSFGIVSSVPFSHATPAAAAAHVNDRNKYHDDSVVEVAQNGGPALDEDGNPIPADVDEFGHPIPDTDNIFRQIVEETQPAVVLGGGHPEAETEFNYISEDGYNELVNGEYDDVYTFLERGPNAGQTLLETAAEIDPDNGERLFGLYGARGQSGNLPWSTADGDYSNTGLSSRTDAERPLEEGETVEEFIATERDENPTLKELTQASLDVLGNDDDGFWVTIEGGDIDWSAHDNNLDNMIGTTLDFANSVGVVQDWIENNGGYDENLLIVTADHDHYFTLNEDFPELLRTRGAEALTVSVDGNGDPLLETNEDGELEKVDNEDPQASGHYWGSDPNEKYGWGTHTTRPVPVYYQGAGSEYLNDAVGQGFESYGQQVPGIDGYIDQVHIAEAQFDALGL